jgi:hypothetical protein
MRHLQERHGMKLFFFCDDSFAPHRMGRLADMIVETDLVVEWVAETRLDRKLTPELCAQLAQGGCRHLIFGLESAAQRVLDLMDKGTKIEYVPEILQNCHQAEIGAVLMTFVGFPTETAEEAQTTIDFLKSVEPIISLATLSHFMLMKGSSVDCSPAQYGIRAIHRPPANKLAYIYKYELVDGIADQHLNDTFLKASRQLDAIFGIERNLFHSVHLFLHTTHRKTIKLRALYPQPSPPSDLLDLVLRLPDSLHQDYVRKDDLSLYIVFDQVTGETWHLTNRERQLLALCNGEASVRDILDCSTEPTSGIQNIKNWFQDLAFVKDLVKKGFQD